MDLGIAGRRAAVAAASGGLGFAVAQRLAEEGAKVVVCGRDQTRIGAAAERIGSGAIGVVADVSTAEGGAAFVSAAADALGAPPEILVANGGGPPPAGFDEATLDQYRAALDANLLASVGMCQAAVPHMREAGWGRVVAVTSAVVRMPAPYLALSNTARAGLHGFLKTMANAVAADGVTVNAVLPGLHDTDRMNQLYGGTPSADNVPVGVIGRPDDFGAVATFLCSDHARFITGTSIPVDGGAYPGLF